MKLNEQVKRGLARAWMWKKLRGVPVPVHTMDLETDGRKRTALVERLLEAGFIEAVAQDTKTAWGTVQVFPTDKIVEEIGNAPLAHYVDPQGTPGAYITALTAPEMIWVGLNPKGVAFTRADCGRETYVPDVAHDQKRVAMGALYVAQAAHCALREHAKWSAHIDQLVAHNLSAGLHELQIISQADFDKLTMIGGFTTIAGRFPTFDQPVGFDDWSARLDVSIQNALDTLLVAHERLSLYRRVEKGIAAFGGWDEFRSTLRARVIVESHKLEAQLARKAVQA